jgi:hypothetical protein
LEWFQYAIRGAAGKSGRDHDRRPDKAAARGRQSGTRDMDQHRYAIALGQAVISVWGELPKDVQHKLFEAAVMAGHHSERDEALREQMAVFLHDQHPRTVN